jgi:uncharacterized HhH-GPD family protein
LLNTDGTALLVGMLLDQQVPMEVAFRGPATLAERLRPFGPFAATTIAGLDEDAFVTLCCERPAIHRFPAVMARRIHALSHRLVDEFDGDGAAVWRGVASGDDLYGRLRTLPGFGDEKARIMIAILGKRMGVEPAGWRAAAGKFGDDVPRSVADSSSPESLSIVREWKRAQRAARLDKQDRPLPRPREPRQPRQPRQPREPRQPRQPREPGDTP